MNIIEIFTKNSTKQNTLYALGAISAGYIVKSVYNLFSGYINERKHYNDIINIIDIEKEKISQDDLQNSKQEICFYLYYKILNSVYKNEITAFDNKRRYYFDNNSIDKYITCVEEYLKNLKFLEQTILQIIYENLQIDQATSDNFKYEKFDIKYFNF